RALALHTLAKERNSQRTMVGLKAAFPLAYPHFSIAEFRSGCIPDLFDDNQSGLVRALEWHLRLRRQPGRSLPLLAYHDSRCVRRRLVWNVVGAEHEKAKSSRSSERPHSVGRALIHA